jgi:hypothetical protein
MRGPRSLHRATIGSGSTSVLIVEAVPMPCRIEAIDLVARQAARSILTTNLTPTTFKRQDCGDEKAASNELGRASGGNFFEIG